MDTRLIELLVCPICKGPLQRSDDKQHLVCPADRLGFPIRDGIPVMLENEAIALDHLAATQTDPLPASPSE